MVDRILTDSDDRPSRRVRVAFVSTYPPRECGIATFTRDLIEALAGHNPPVEAVVAAVDEDAVARPYPPRVRWRILQHDVDTYVRTARELSASGVDVVNLQHEFGIFGGEWGAYVLRLGERPTVPLVTTLHTVLPDPPPVAEAIIRALCEHSAAVVVMTRSAVDILRREYGVDDRRVRVIPHGVPPVSRQDPARVKADLGLSGRRVLSTFGLLNPGKGIEDVIDALVHVVPRHPDVLYLVLGETHPMVRRQQGESYREWLQERVRQRGLEEHVRFENRYLPDRELIRYLLATDVYITPYHNPRQIVSGTLSYALGCGRAIISTPYLYARDVLAEGRGLLVPFRAPREMAAAITRLLEDPHLRERLQRAAYSLGRQMAWPRVAAAYGELFAEVAAARAVAF
ncbi:MAG: glycosyltransferase family 4 protein [Armatimonadota bacterium]|nr:glycosyltransferase family 4 protein [Armatimonadota bacterium]MDR7437384.1 glycosyltransferase family 4 protein [Armatimonadota bacterium]MDR7472800.1 glycosyltransferase family 4 protein [Armatimonadota bacterium]MDR7506849.1 glycosyltransferase family 4 protein [Armatimonadota bacterium]MDR7509278.1 glycosyltransferase family 4 protein [Armatimonadota bacterium]